MSGWIEDYVHAKNVMSASVFMKTYVIGLQEGGLDPPVGVKLEKLIMQVK